MVEKSKEKVLELKNEEQIYTSKVTRLTIFYLYKISIINVINFK